MDFRYSLTKAPEARTDGSGCVDHDIVAQVNEGAGWYDVPARHKTISIPWQAVEDALDAGNNGAIVTAYKQSMVDNLNTQPEPVTGWTVVQMEAMITANNNATGAAGGANTFITDTLGLSYPVPFTV